jgi:hypothetical protein
MHLQLPTDDANNFTLPATRVLDQIHPGHITRHDSLGLRRPLGVYNTSVATLAQRLTGVTRLLALVINPEAASGDVVEANKENLLDSYEALLHALMHHMEDCVGVLKGFTRDDAAFPKESAVKRYGQAVRQYRSHIGKVVNRIKHQQGRLRLLTVRMGPSRFGGYFVERGLPGGGVGPDPDIHQGGVTAFSFNRDLRYHVCEIVFTSAALADAIERLTGVSRSGAPPARQPLGGAVADVASLPETYFPDEYEKPRPVLRLEGDAPSGRRLVVGFESSDGWRPFAGRTFQVDLELRGDGATRSWKLPYGPGSSGA